jgi:hypothetical protein
MERYLQDGRGHSPHHGVAADRSLSDGCDRRWNVDVQPLGQDYETRQVYREQFGQEGLQAQRIWYKVI